LLQRLSQDDCCAELAASLVRSLFCGLPNPERRMAVFVAASDEATDGTDTGPFLLGGWVARELLWSRSFAPRWQRHVLNGPPKIDYLHMVDIKSPKWRAEHGITVDDAERRLDAAFDIIDGAGGMFPIVYRVDAGHFRTQFADVKLLIETEGGVARKRFEPDYICFLHYALQVLNYMHVAQKDAEKVDFIVERNGPITKHIERFHRSIAKSLKELDADHLSRFIEAESWARRARAGGRLPLNVICRSG
jgi:hypothetical protein